MITRDSIEQAYSFFHQKWRVYKFSTMEWQRDDIESAIGDYVAMMSPDLYRAIARGNSHYLLDHTAFADDLESAVDRLEQLLA